MKIEDQVCSLELAKRLKELGVNQESVFWWTDEDLVLMGGYKNTDWKISDTKGLYEQCAYTSAFTVAELGEMLPEGTTTEPFAIGQYLCTYRRPNHKRVSIYEPTEADARAKMLIYLIGKQLTSRRLPPVSYGPPLSGCSFMVSSPRTTTRHV